MLISLDDEINLKTFSEVPTYKNIKRKKLSTNSITENCYEFEQMFNILLNLISKISIPRKR